MKRFLSKLTRSQRIALVGMIIANVVVLALAFVVLRGNTAATSFTPIPESDCSDIAARLMARQNLAGSASLGPDNILRLHLTGEDTTGQPLPRATEAAWDALEAILSLPSLGCGPYPSAQVDVPFDTSPDAAQTITSTTRLLVTADWVDLRAWGYGELDDGALAQRLQTTLYTQPSK